MEQALPAGDPQLGRMAMNRECVGVTCIQCVVTLATMWRIARQVAEPLDQDFELSQILEVSDLHSNQISVDDGACDAIAATIYENIDSSTVVRLQPRPVVVVFPFQR